MDDLLNTAPGGFLRFTDEGIILLANFTLANSLGYESDELPGKSIEFILSVASRIFYQTHLFPLLRLKGEVNEVYLSLRSRTGAEIPVLLNALRREDPEGAPNGAGINDGTVIKGAVNDCILIPIRQRNEYEDEILRAKRIAEEAKLSAEAARLSAEEANRTKDEFLATLSHELRTPLTSIVGWAAILKSQRISAGEMARGLDVIERNARTQAQLIEDILDVSRMITGKMRLDVKPIDLRGIVEETLNTTIPAAQAKGIRLERVFEEGEIMVSGDPVRLQQVIWNLLSNALKFTLKGGRVQVRLEPNISHVELVISDSGQGIASEILPHIFDRFRQADSSSTRTHAGLGLGLAIVRQLVELHGGIVEAQSEGLGKGAVFTVKLPLLAPSSVDLREADTTRPPMADEAALGNVSILEGLHVLVVDDQEDICFMLSVALERCGARVTTANSAVEALSALQESRPDVLLSDIGMEGENGFSLIQKVRELALEVGGQTPAAALTAFAREEDRIEVLQAGFQAHLPKPIDLVELTRMVATLAGRQTENLSMAPQKASS
jgi:PAS domain S-box-containing protein